MGKLGNHTRGALGDEDSELAKHTPALMRAVRVESHPERSR
jgi:hypothetical protein